MPYLKSPLNYVGGKYKLLKEIIPLFPHDISTFVDLFGGGFNVGINVDAKRVIYNDINEKVVRILKSFKETSTENLLQEIHNYIDTFELSKENSEGFAALRNYYNTENDDPIVLYVLICHSFNYQIRFNRNGQYNMPFGKSKSSFNKSLEQNFVKFVDELHSGRYSFGCSDFTKINLNLLTEKDLVYCDPPYLGSNTTYNVGEGWTAENEQQLLNLLDMMNNKGIKFALSNNLKYKNKLLEDWMAKYNVIYIECNYGNCNYHLKDRDKGQEILVTNYSVA